MSGHFRILGWYNFCSSIEQNKCRAKPDPVRACLVETVPFRFLIQIVCFLPFQNRKNPLFTMEMVAEQNRTVPTEQALRDLQLG